MKQNKNKQQNTDNTIKFMRPMANYTWMDHKRNAAILKDLKQNQCCLKYQHIVKEPNGFNMSGECKEIW